MLLLVGIAIVKILKAFECCCELFTTSSMHLIPNIFSILKHLSKRREIFSCCFLLHNMLRQIVEKFCIAFGDVLVCKTLCQASKRNEHEMFRESLRTD